MALHRARQADAEWCVESFNARLRNECLNVHLFANLNEVRQIIEEQTQHQPTAHEPLTRSHQSSSRPVRTGQSQNGLSLQARAN